MSAGERLRPILAAVAERARLRRAHRSLSDLRAELEVDPRRARAFARALGGPELAFIAECKRRAPSAGLLSTEAGLDERIRTYARGGAAALSILTEADHFDGSLDDLRAAPEVALPRLCKDFLLDEAMLLEAQLAGASAVLLIVAGLEPGQLDQLREVARAAGLGVLIEVHDERELELAAPLAPEALGVNARDLSTFAIDLAVTERLLPLIPAGCLRVAESGLHDVDDLRRVRAAGADAALVGTALMRSADAAATLCEWRRALDG
jgi:indole-3-glycerol phosphate synthase